MLWEGLLLHYLLEPRRKGRWIASLKTGQNRPTTEASHASSRSDQDIERQDRSGAANKEGKKTDHVSEVSSRIESEPALDKKDIVTKKDPVNIDQLEQVAKLNTLEEIRVALDEVEHPLRYVASRLVFSPYDSARVMVIGEAPGEEEDKQGLPFVGASGQLLEQAFNCVDLYRDRDLYIANIVPFRPPGNRTPIDSEIAFFKLFVYRQVELINPKIIVLVGSTAYKAFFDDKIPISKARGRFLKWRDWDVLVVFHPSYLLRAPSAKQSMWHDMIALRQWLDS